MNLADVVWRKSSRSTNNGTCVEAAALTTDLVATRDSKAPEYGTLTVSRSEWTAFLTAVRTDALR